MSRARRDRIRAGIVVGLATATVLAWGFSGCAAVKEAKRIEQKAEQRGTQIGLGALAGGLASLALDVAFWPAAAVGGFVAVVVIVFEPEEVAVTVEDGGTLVMGTGDVEKLRDDLDRVRNEKIAAEQSWWRATQRWIARCVWIGAVSAFLFVVSRFPWLRRFLIRRAGEAHSRFWSLVHAFFPGEKTRRKALRLP